MNQSFPLRVALFCGICPLLLGVSIFLLWLATGWQWLMLAGIATIFCGTILVALGICSLAAYCGSRVALPAPRLRRGHGK